MKNDYPMRTENKRSEKGESMAKPGKGGDVASDMRVGSSKRGGIGFPVPNHPDRSVVSPEK